MYWVTYLRCDRMGRIKKAPRFLEWTVRKMTLTKKGKTVGEGGWEKDCTSFGYLRFEMTTCDGWGSDGSWEERSSQEIKFGKPCQRLCLKPWSDREWDYRGSEGKEKMSKYSARSYSRVEMSEKHWGLAKSLWGRILDRKGGGRKCKSEPFHKTSGKKENNNYLKEREWSTVKCW